jgi:hypothetical protein
MGGRALRLFGTGIVVATCRRGDLRRGRDGDLGSMGEGACRQFGSACPCDSDSRRGWPACGGGTHQQGWQRSDDRFMTGTSGLARLVDEMLLVGAILRWVPLLHARP